MYSEAAKNTPETFDFGVWFVCFESAEILVEYL